jgi:hypothetical protein
MYTHCQAYVDKLLSDNQHLRKKLVEKDQTLDLLAELFAKITSMLPAKVK